MAFTGARIKYAWEVERGLTHCQHGPVINGGQAGFSILGFQEKGETIRSSDGLNILISHCSRADRVPERNSIASVSLICTRATNSKGRKEEAVKLSSGSGG